MTTTVTARGSGSTSAGRPAKQAGIPAECAKAILGEAGFHTCEHTNIMEAVEIVCRAVGVESAFAKVKRD
jgi:hypothetical protein